VFVARGLLEMHKLVVRRSFRGRHALPALAFYSTRPAGPEEEARRFAILRVLQPAFEATLATLARLGGARNALATLAEPVAVFGPDGRALHRNPALDALLAAEPDQGRVEAALGRYTLRGTLLAESPFSADGAVVVMAERAGGAALPSAEEVRARFGLTKRESEVALLLAEGLKNDAITERLGLSPHTARRHTEAVRQKLLVESRAAVAARLLAPA
jgi:DNA-binding CsgD family transcriptional regulator